MMKSKLLWVLLVLVALLGGWYSLNYFGDAFPIADITVTMDRETATQKADSLVTKYDIGLENYSQAASFDVDSRVQHFVELEGGGKSVFKEMMKEGWYEPYKWKVRHFTEQKTTEVQFRFTPTGEPYGFNLSLPEDQPGPQLSADSARTIAEAGAAEDWNVNLGSYELIEAQETEQPEGRLDHTFVYEHSDRQLGAGQYRLRLRIAGDQLAEVTHFIHIPEEFSRNYAEMRSANNTIATSASIAMGLLYVLGGIIGLIILMRQGWLLWKKAALWAFIIALLQFLADLNQLPLAWMSYDTALSSQSFIIQRIVGALGNFVFMGLIMTLSFMVAETLGRRAFPHHYQFWKLWKPEYAGSKTILGYTLGGYLLVTLFFAYNVTLYLFASDALGWWNPTNALYEPNILANIAPWFNPIARSAQAGFWEECLFRAIPIAGAALLGNRFGGRKWWIGGALIVQAIIFGAAHANYPAQPAYARMVELIIPSIGFGLLYIYFGLLPGIVLHFTYDVIWFAMPLFASESSGVLGSKAVLVIATFIPLIVVLYGWYKNGRLVEHIETIKNRYWAPADGAEVSEEEKQKEEASERAYLQRSQSSSLLRSAALFGGVGLLLLVLSIDWDHQGSNVKVDKHEARDNALQYLKDSYPEVSPEEWRVMPTFSGPLNKNDRFVWQEGGAEAYTKLYGSYLGPPNWQVRLAKFEGDQKERAEEYRITIEPDGSLMRMGHKLHETEAGDSLNERQANQLADSVVEHKWNKDPRQLELIEASPSKKPNRRDWLFTYSDTSSYPMSQGEARLNVSIAGSEIVNAYQTIHVPQEWQREQRNKRSIINIIQTVLNILFMLLMVGGLVWGVILWTRGQFDRRAFITTLATLSILSLVSMVLNWSNVVAGFSTAEPFANQYWMSLVGGILRRLALAGAVALVAGLIVDRISQRKSAMAGKTVYISGISFGLLLTGLLYGFRYLEPSMAPVWPDYGFLDASLPSLEVWIRVIRQFIIQVTGLAFFVILVDEITGRWTTRKIWGVLLFLFLGLFIGNMSGIPNLAWWATKSVVFALAVWGIYLGWLRYGFSAIPGIILVYMITQNVQQAVYGAVPGSVFIYTVTLVLLIGVMIFISQYLRKITRIE